MAFTIWRAMYLSGAGIGMIAVITAAVRGVTRVGLLQALPVWCGTAAGPTAPAPRGALLAPTPRLTSATTFAASGACVLEVSQAGERSDKQARSGAAPVRREVRAGAIWAVGDPFRLKVSRLEGGRSRSPMWRDRVKR